MHTSNKKKTNILTTKSNEGEKKGRTSSIYFILCLHVLCVFVFVLCVYFILSEWIDYNTEYESYWPLFVFVCVVCVLNCTWMFMCALLTFICCFCCCLFIPEYQQWQWWNCVCASCNKMSCSTNVKIEPMNIYTYICEPCMRPWLLRGAFFFFSHHSVAFSQQISIRWLMCTL